MVESLEHKKLKQKAVSLLIDKGYEEDKILIDKKWVNIEYHGHFYKFRIDVFASNSHEFAIECGNFPKWKHPIYEQQFGREYVLHIPHSVNFGKYKISDVEEGLLNKQQAKQFLLDTYLDQVYKPFKEDPIFDFQEFTETSRGIFDIDNHRTFKEVNPDYGDKNEVIGKDIWMNFPDSSTISKSEYRKNIHWGMIYYFKDIISIVIFFSGVEPCQKFLDLSPEVHSKIVDALKKLPGDFFVRDGFSFWDKNPVQPLDKEWNVPIPCDQLDIEQYEDVLENLKNLIELQKNHNKVGPVLNLCKVFCHANEISEYIEEFRELYSILLKPNTVYDTISRNIKEMVSWEYYISNSREWDFLCKEYEEKYNNQVEPQTFKKACKKLRYDPDFIKYMKE